MLIRYLWMLIRGARTAFHYLYYNVIRLYIWLHKKFFIMPVKNTEAKRLEPAKLQKAKDGITALGQISGYNPQRKEYGADKVAALSTALTTTGAAEIAAKNAWDKARDAAVKAEWDVHNFMQGASEQVQGQYGSDSDEYASIGYKKKSEYKKGTPKKKTFPGS